MNRDNRPGNTPVHSDSPHSEGPAGLSTMLESSHTKDYTHSKPVFALFKRQEQHEDNHLSRRLLSNCPIIDTNRTKHDTLFQVRTCLTFDALSIIYTRFCCQCRLGDKVTVLVNCSAIVCGEGKERWAFLD